MHSLPWSRHPWFIPPCCNNLIFMYYGFRVFKWAKDTIFKTSLHSGKWSGLLAQFSFVKWTLFWNLIYGTSGSLEYQKHQLLFFPSVIYPVHHVTWSNLKKGRYHHYHSLQFGQIHFPYRSSDKVSPRLDYLNSYINSFILQIIKGAIRSITNYFITASYHPNVDQISVLFSSAI